MFSPRDFTEGKLGITASLFEIVSSFHFPLKSILAQVSDLSSTTLASHYYIPIGIVQWQVKIANLKLGKVYERIEISCHSFVMGILELYFSKG